MDDVAAQARRTIGERLRGARESRGVSLRTLAAQLDVSPATLSAVETGVFSPDDRGRYRGLVDNLRHHDHFMVTADFDAYWATQRAAGTLWQDRDAWDRKAILNTARMGWFSADRAITDYARDIWGAEPGIP